MTVIDEMKAMVNKNFIIDYLMENTNAQREYIEEYLINNWAAAKQRLFSKYFHNNSLTIEKEISFCLPFKETQLGKEWCVELSDLRRDIYFSINDDDQDSRSLRQELDDYMRDLNTDKKYTHKQAAYISNISDKTKLIRACHKLFERLDVDDDYVIRFEELMNKRSLIIQEAWTKGTLVLSIDPMDFLTASDNNCGWSSCFSILRNGECRGSVYSAAITPDIMIGYIKTKDDFIYGDYNIPNKKWRAWILDNDESKGHLLYVAKNYPFVSDGITNYLYNWLFEFNCNNYVPCNIPWRFEEEFMYVDYHSDDTYYIPKDDADQYHSWQDGPLVSWGCYPIDLENGEYTLEENRDVCLSYASCYECGASLREEDIFYAEDECYCEDCFYKYFFFCDACGEPYRLEEQYDANGQNMCEYCFYEYRRTRLQNCSYEQEDGDEDKAIDTNETIDKVSYPKIRPSF